MYELLALFAHRHTIPSLVFRNIHSLIGAGDQSFKIGRIFILCGHPNTGSHRDFVFQDPDRLCRDGGTQSFSDTLRRFAVRLREQDDDLLAAITPD